MKYLTVCFILAMTLVNMSCDNLPGNLKPQESSKMINNPVTEPTPDPVTEPNPDFVTRWRTNATGKIVSGIDQIKLPLDLDGEYDFTVDWGDGTSDHIASYNDASVTHTYAVMGEYDVTITGLCEGFGFKDTGTDNDKFITVKNWGTVVLHNKGGQFQQCDNLETFVATDTPCLETITDIHRMFFECDKFNGNINNWDVSNIEHMYSLFRFAKSYNQPLDKWSFPKIYSIGDMFWCASSFDQPLNDWDVSNITIMDHAFGFASSFDRPLDSWDVSSVTDMSYMSSGASSFNGSIGGWDVANEIDMFCMLDGSLLELEGNEPDWYWC
ncbi:MAG: DUF285 domain-containing protein [Spirochaetes bacterium]|nr:DUF285 domain-containing protein [Spirochaetota bacterium]MBN2769343.1 DUF285 domain-containing protein [Spirochaetota bacterium]